MGVSLDGYIVRPDGGFQCSAPDEEVFRFATDEVRQVGVHLLGRRLYETMRCWETADQDPSLSDLEREFAALWTSLPKVVFSATLSAVDGGGTPFFPRSERRVDLGLVDSRTFSSGVAYLDYRVAH